MHRNSFRVAGILAALLLFFTACDSGSGKTKVDQIQPVSGADQYTLPGTEFAKPLVIVVNGANVPGWLGGKGNRPPVVNTVVSAIADPDSDLTVTPATAATDVAGVVSFRVRAGKSTGDHYIRITPLAAPELTFSVRFTVGAEVRGANQEVSVGRIAPQPIAVKLVQPDGKPAAAVPVYFKVLSSPTSGTAGAEVLPEAAVTNAEGEAATHVKLGNVSGEYQIGIEVADPAHDYFIRQIPVRILGLNLTKVIINVIGGLAIFIFGMKLMSDGLLKIAGDKMKKILHFFSRNGFVAVMAGTAVTAVIQSSGATTIMVIGFINAGLLNLTQGIGIIFGANIGTTVTAQIISFDMNALAMPTIAVGLIGMFAQKRVIRGWGEAVFGFGMLFYGMGVMCSELKVLGMLPSFQSFFRTFDCAPTDGIMPIMPVLGAILLGILLTVAIQSSSAAMGIVLAMAGGGLINFYTSIPLILGTNIGTTTIAFFAAFAANRIAKQAAMAHFLFNVIGSILMLLGFYIPWGAERIPVYLAFINYITPGDVFAEIPQNIERHIAMAHTMFNVVNTLLLTPFIVPFARLCEHLIPERNDRPEETTMLEPHLLATPTAALEQVVLAIRSMVDESWKMVNSAVNEQFVKLDLDKKKIAHLTREEEKIDKMQADVTGYLVQITRRSSLTEHQSELIPLLMHCTNDAERIADHTANIIALAERLAKSEKRLSGASYKAIEKVWKTLDNEARAVIASLGSTDEEKVRLALKSERKINRLTGEFEQESIDRLRKGSCILVNSVIFIELLGEFEKLGDHLTNIAERTPEIQKHYINL